LSRLLSTSRITRTKPDWLLTDSACYYLLLTDSIAAPLYLRGDELHVASFFYRDMTEGKRRSNRNKDKARARSGKAGKRRANRMQTGKPVSGPDVSEWRD
jgi:hypothetical protein